MQWVGLLAVYFANNSLQRIITSAQMTGGILQKSFENIELIGIGNA